MNYRNFHFSLLLSAMASSDLRAELDCSICLNIYTDPVMLKCGHNFCRVCIDRVFDTQEGSGDYSCPQCREEFKERPSLHSNLFLRNITQGFLSASPEPEKSGIFCTYCIHSSVPAVKSCLLCEASLCDDHLRVHSKSPEHVICVPTSTPENRKCPVHKKILEYYCTEDSACICVSCSLTGEHRGHQVETLQEVSMKRKKKLINNLQKLITKRGRTEDRVQSLKEHRGKVQGNVNGEEKRVLDLFRDLRRRLEDLEKRVLGEISRQAKGVLSPINDLIQELELKTEDLSRKMRHLEELCAMTDPLAVLQESDSGDLCDTEDGDDEYRKRHEKLLRDGGALDVTAVSHTLGQGLSDVISGAIGGIYIQKADILLDEDTANNYVCISSDKKTASRSGRSQNHTNSSERFEEYPQVLGNQSFSSGRHYWEVDLQTSNNWRIGMSYDHIDRDGDDSLIGANDVSWGLSRVGKKYSLIHDMDETELPDNLLGNKVRVYLDYEAGQISFYMCDPLHHLHTFTATFTEPLYAVLGVWHSSISLS
ncbi:E3 ubiquitin-protein ligase TRIM11-like [Rana temporaria]|uniref:E3 ubiquitin-protein ligase TRIM11-like n=1 Tax=Rana temporaria TaxID=8407 RepID=UPI001AAD283F|nr:E3 ubiquitin-protein ligase TRIM11-like [Rana temporaria]